ncbi:methyl-accepting chemotaxis protein [Camelliibacillus cellulosilyticus]|uniref:Methyl-accepting chemotaxis protein n=1 Tax=Camelliibacillus cellulosilyticus TaxID=2174486 RepID=A0ABV9GJP5_9BACL
MNWTIKKRIRLIIGSSLIGIIIFGGFMALLTVKEQQSTNQVKKISNAVNIAQNISAMMETTRKNDQVYINRPSVAAANLVEANIKQLKRLNDDLKGAGVNVEKETKAIDQSISQYASGFTSLKSIKESIGYNDRSGLRQSISDSEKTLQSVLAKTKDSTIIIQGLNVNLMEKAYMETPNEINYSHFTSELDALDNKTNGHLNGDIQESYSSTVLKLKSIMDTLNNSNKLADSILDDFNKNAASVKKDVDGAVQKLNDKKDQIYASQSTTDAVLIIIMIVLTIVVIGVLAVLGVWLIKSITRSIDNLKNGAGVLGEGRLNYRVPIIGNDEMAELSVSFNQMAENMEQTILQVTAAADKLSSSSQNLAAVAQETTAQAIEMNEAVQQVAIGAQNQAEHLEESMDLLSNVSKAVEASTTHSEAIFLQSQNAQEANRRGVEVVRVLEKGSDQFLQIAKHLISDIQEVADQSEKITSILKIIQDISSNTDLLALNAAIESARAGEAGRGFAVVSHEIRKLAERSKKETANIQNVIGLIIGRLNNIAKEADKMNAYCNEQGQNVAETKTAFDEIAGHVNSINGKITSIKEAIVSVTNANVELSTKLEEISAISEETAASTEQVSASSENQTAAIESVSEAASELQEIALTLEQEVAKFDIASDIAALDADLADEPDEKTADGLQADASEPLQADPEDVGKTADEGFEEEQTAFRDEAAATTETNNEENKN